MTNAQPFFDGVQNVNAESVKSVKALAETMLILTAQNILDGLTSWFAGETSLETFGKEIASFAPYYKQYADTIQGVDFNTVQNSAIAAKSIAEFANNIPNQGGILAKIVGDNTISQFAEMLPDLGTNLKAYADNVSGLDGEVVENSVKSAKSIAEFAQNIPNQGGLASFFAGDNTIEEFSKHLPEFGKNLKAYADNVSGLDSNVVENSMMSAKSISEFANNLPNSGGVVSWFTGDNSIDKFGEKLAKFGKSFKEYYDYIKDIIAETVITITNALIYLVQQLTIIQDNDVGQSAKDFADKLKDFGKDFGKYYENIKDIGTGQVNSVTSALASLISQLIIVKTQNLGEIAKNFGEDIKTLSSDIKEALTENITVKYDDMYQIGNNVGKGIYDGINSHKNNISTLASNIKDDIKDNTNIEYRDMWSRGNNVSQGLYDGIDNKSGSIFNIISNIKGNINDNTNINYNDMWNKGNNVSKGIYDGIRNNENNISNITTNIKNSINNNTKVNYNDIWKIGNNVGQGLIDGMNNKSWSVSYTARNIAQNIVTQFKNELQIHSPSEIMENLSKFIPLGIAKGIDEEADTVYDSISKLNQGIKVNTQDFEVDTNQYVNYSAIKGQILTQSQVSVNNSIAGEIRQAVIEGMRNSKITVEVEGKADKDGIFKVVQTEAKEYTMQTGQPAFSY